MEAKTDYVSSLIGYFISRPRTDDWALVYASCISETSKASNGTINECIASIETLN